MPALPRGRGVRGHGDHALDLGWGAHATHPDTGAEVAVGKRTGVNNFCIGVAGNWARCTSCHVGYGWKDDGFLGRARPVDVDCLVCHDGSGTGTRRTPPAPARPTPGVDLLAAARAVGRTTRATCGTCHFKGGGGDGVKHGDLDETMYFPSGARGRPHGATRPTVRRLPPHDAP